MARALEEKLIQAGYQLLGPRKEIEELIISILKTKDTRYLKAIPVLIYLHNPDLSELIARTKNKNLLAEIIEITRKIFVEEGIKKELPPIDKFSITKKMKLDYSEFKQEFELQRRRAEPPTLLYEQGKFQAERNLQWWLSFLFTRKERSIIERILQEKMITKTEYEYYSRKTKKKLNAIINLQEFTKAMVPLSPKTQKK